MIAFLLITLLLSSISLADAYFYLPNSMLNLPFQGGMATAQRNNTLIMFGGENATDRFTNNLYQLSQLSDTFQWQAIEQKDPPPGTLYGQAVVTNNNFMYLFGGMTNDTKEKILPLQYYRFSFDTNTWTAAPTNTENMPSNATFPVNRMLFSATYDGQNKIYIYGGSINSSLPLPDFHVFDITTHQFTRLPDPNFFRYGHTASYLSNGLIVMIGGTIQGDDPIQNPSRLAPMDVLSVFDTKSNQWGFIQTTKDESTALLSTRNSHSAVVTSDDRIVVFGGHNNDEERKRMFVNSVAILDTKTRIWTSPIITGIPPSRRGFAAAGLLDDKHLVVAFGTGLNMYFNDINVLNIDTSAWLQTFGPAIEKSLRTSLSAGAIAGISVACVALSLILVFLIWKFQGYIRWFAKRVHRDIWKPRTGEPLWAETTRIVFQIFLFLLFSVFLAFVIRQAITSPNVTQTIEKSSSAVQIPDVRFCYDGFPAYASADVRAPFVSCHTDYGYSCTQFVQPLNMSTFQPTYASNLGPVNCFLFRAPEDFVLSSTSGNNNGSMLLFKFYGDELIDYGRIHTSVYPKRMDPNIAVYGISDDIPNLVSEINVRNWLNNERNDIQATNVFTMEPFTYNSLAYDLIDHRYLQDVSWNYVGFLPVTNSTPEIETYFRQGSPNPTYNDTHEDIGIMAVFPHAFVETVKREVKMYTLLNALGFVGGVFGLLVAAQAWLFGYRPRSPWGVVHRWSVGDMKRSLLHGLQTKFKISDSGIPLVHPVHHRFSVKDQLEHDEPEKERIRRVEERMQMLEMLFKAYYVDDEVFRSLDDANRSRMIDSRGVPSDVNDSGRFQFQDNGVPRTEKMTDHGSANKPVVNPHSFKRYDTDESSASNIPLTRQHRQHALPYQPTTTVQLQDDYT